MVATPKPIDAAANVIAIIVIRKYFIIPPLKLMVVDGARRELFRTAEGEL